MRLALGWYGGKFYLVDRLATLFPPHRIYVEPFGGGAAVLLNKPPSEVEVYNDINQCMVSFFRVLRDEEKMARLMNRLRLTPFSREEHRYACQHYRDDDLDVVEQAALFFTATYQSINYITGNSWARDTPQGLLGDARNARAWLGRIDKLPLIAERLRRVVLECADFEWVIRNYDSGDTLFYMDPPYLPETRRDVGTYEHEMSNEDHIRLLEAVQHVKGKVVLSGYPNELYNGYLAHWHVRDFRVKCWSSVPSAGEQSHTKPDRIERVWLNYDPRITGQMCLLDAEGCEHEHEQK